MVLVHRYVVETIEGRALAPGQIVMHRCDNPPCMAYSHLKRTVQLENVRDMEQKGRAHRVHGEAHPNAKLTAAQAAAIRTAPGSQRAVARQFGVSRNLVRLIRAGRAWKGAAA